MIGYRSEGRLRIAGGLYRHEQTEMRWYVLVAGKLVATGLRQGSGPSFGKDSDRKSHEPWGAYEPEYAFARTACTGCAEGVDAIAFTSAFHDADHGYGVLTVDAARAVVLHERLVPYAFNGPTTTGTIDTDFGETELGWRPRAVHGDFAGRVGPFSGTAHLEDVLHDYRRFPTVEGAIAALSP